MKPQTTKNAFLDQLKTKKTVSYLGQGLKANLALIEPKNSKRAYSIDYYYNSLGNWVKFSTMVSFFLSDIVKDFENEFSIYENN